MLKAPIIALAASFGVMLLADFAAAQDETPERLREHITLRVPVKMHNMLATQVRVRCWIYSQAGQVLSQGPESSTVTDWYDISNGELDRVIEVAMRPQVSFAEAATYRCLLELPNYMNCGMHQGPPENYDPKDHGNWCIAKPDQFFRSHIEGRLVPRRWPGSKDSGQQSGNSNDLTIGPKERH